MNDRGIRRWTLLGALAAAALLTPACDRQWPREGSEYEGLVNEGQKNERSPSPIADPQAPQELGTGGSGFLQDGTSADIGAPGYSTPRESLLPEGSSQPPEDTSKNIGGGYYRRGEELRPPVRGVPEPP
ncbi:hypothetical protein [Hyalangium sp.]|uniref:hypothetical protein n=1 Tax=Hyalangium sp. TaxID=2028555 RepID=UPI002D2D9A00|nr:hypothetical protein [Hyalangium sp.]HYH96862.1 hypothetical protein [Hyalangium sp.]